MAESSRLGGKKKRKRKTRNDAYLWPVERSTCHSIPTFYSPSFPRLKISSVFNCIFRVTREWIRYIRLVEFFRIFIHSTFSTLHALSTVEGTTYVSSIFMFSILGRNSTIEQDDEPRGREEREKKKGERDWSISLHGALGNAYRVHHDKWSTVNGTVWLHRDAS